MPAATPPTSTPHRAMRYTTDELLAAVRRGWDAGLTRRHIWQERHSSLGLPSHDTICKYLGSWSNAVVGIGETPGQGPDHGKGPGTGYAAAHATGGLPHRTKPICTAHMWTVENVDGEVVYREFTYPTLTVLKRYPGHSVVRVDFECPA